VGVDGYPGVGDRSGQQAGGGRVPQSAQSGAGVRGAARWWIQPVGGARAGGQHGLRAGGGSGIGPMTVPALPGLIDPLVRQFLDERASLEAALADYGSPLNLVFPQVFEENLLRLRAVLEQRPAPYRICYAHKVNQSSALVRAAADAGIGIDVASAEELASARRGGF